jgi:hypothetical protein
MGAFTTTVGTITTAKGDPTSSNPFWTNTPQHQHTHSLLWQCPRQWYKVQDRGCSARGSSCGIQTCSYRHFGVLVKLCLLPLALYPDCQFYQWNHLRNLHNLPEMGDPTWGSYGQCLAVFPLLIGSFHRRWRRVTNRALVAIIMNIPIISLSL